MVHIFRNDVVFQKPYPLLVCISTVNKALQDLNRALQEQRELQKICTNKAPGFCSSTSWKKPPNSQNRSSIFGRSFFLVCSKAALQKYFQGSIPNDGSYFKTHSICDL